MPVTRFMSLLQVLSRARNLARMALRVVILLGDFASGERKIIHSDEGAHRTPHGMSGALFAIPKETLGGIGGRPPAKYPATHR